MPGLNESESVALVIHRSTELTTKSPPCLADHKGLRHERSVERSALHVLHGILCFLSCRLLRNVIMLSDHCRQIIILRSEATKNLILQTMGFFTPVGRSE